MSVFVQASSGSPPHKAAVPEIVRRSSSYHPCVWGDHFLAYNAPDHATPDADTVQKAEVLNKEVKNMLLEAASQPKQQLKLINDIQRLGVAYHFEPEIDGALKRMYDMYHELCGTKSKDELHMVALCFRLLRQHGYYVSSDVFNMFKDESTRAFKECLSKDAEGLLSLYEASHLRVHGEDILDEALAFTTSHLENLKTQLTNPLAGLVIRALKLPLWKTVTRIEARHYISVYGNINSHSKTLLHFAKLDFNLVQKLHQSEAAEVSSWWKSLNIKEKLPFAREKPIETFFWGVGMSFEPQYRLARRVLAAVMALIVVVDDVYDIYGTVEELTLFTEAIQRWDISALDELPEYMRPLYQILLDLYSGVEKEFSKAGIPPSFVEFAKDSLKEITKSYIFESKCLNKWIVPTMETCIPHTIISSTIPILTMSFVVGMGQVVTREALEWLSGNPLLIRAGSLYCRFTDDMAEYKDGKAEDESFLVDVYMKEHGVSKEDTFSELKKRNVLAWKDMNSQCFGQTALPLPLLTAALSMSRLACILYEYQEMDGFTSSNTKTKELIRSVLVDPVPI
ncbi:sesquiterpene synthase Cop-like [Apium graveolens]|uniref:sesquiterpene synthase Cop-like n=1 Tax=Apium graveolens TaxID=4045 RepID=UPI003D79AFC5